MPDETTARPSAEPITAVIAERVRALRDAANWTQGDLAKQMVDRGGVDWKRATVVNLEKRAPSSRGANGGRDSITVQELLALAITLDVPPIMLLADPRNVDEVPVTDTVSVSAWEALMWLAGSGTIGEESDLKNFSSSARLLQAGWAIVENVAELQKRDRVFDPSNPDQVKRAQDRDDARHRKALETIRTALIRINTAEAPVPSPSLLPRDLVYRRAAELDVDLPAMDG